MTRDETEVATELLLQKSKTPGALEKAGVAVLYLFGLFAWLGTGVAHVCLFALTILFLLDFRNAWPVLKKLPLVPLFAACSLYLVVLAVWAAFSLPETSADQRSAVWEWSAPWLFLVVAWWLKGSVRRILCVSGLAALGLAGGVLRKSEWEPIVAGWLKGVRYDFGHAWLGLSFLCVVILLGMFVFSHRYLHTGKNGWQKVAVYVSSLCAALFFTVILIVTQSRGAWLGFVGLLMLWALRSAIYRFRTGMFNLKKAASIAVIAFLLLSLFIFQTDTIRSRFLSEASLVPIFLRLNVDEIPFTSLGLRIHFLHWGGRLFLEKPFFGWGPGTSSTKFLALQNVLPLSVEKIEALSSYPHLHNIFIEILVRFGLVGFLLYLSAFVIVICGIWRARRKGFIPHDFADFIWLTVLFGFFYGFYNFRVLAVDFRFFAILFGGIAYTFVIYSTPSFCFSEEAGGGKVMQEGN